MTFSANANGENRRWATLLIAGAVLTAVSTKLGEWAVEELRRKVKETREKKKGTQ